MDVDSLRYINEYTFTKDSAAAWQNLAQARLEWNRTGGWAHSLQSSLADLYCAFVDTNLADEHLYTRRKGISDVLKLFTAWMDGWAALEKGSLASDCDNRYTAA
eukprot:8278762-Alexandrium_andersonii.AAC.1